MPEGESFDRWLKDFTHQVDSMPQAVAQPRAQEPLSPEEWPAKLERLADERARLQQKNDTSEREIQMLRGRLDTVQSEIADFETRLSRSRQSYEEHIQRLQDQTRFLEEQVRGLREDKAFLEKSLLEELRRLRPFIRDGE